MPNSGAWLVTPFHRVLKILMGSKILIRGGGLIGLSIGWRLLRAGHDVRIEDLPGDRLKASWAAAGMLSADFEAAISPVFDTELHALCVESRARWGRFVRDLETETGEQVFLRSGPTFALMPASFEDTLKERGFAPDEVRIVDDLAAKELAEGYVGSARLPFTFNHDGQVDNRAVLTLLQRVCSGLYIKDAGHEADITIDCRGWQNDGMRPVKGQMVSVEPMAGLPDIPVRWGASYIMPKPDRVIIGATVEPDVTSLETEEIVTSTLLGDAAALFPRLKAATVIESWAGLRPLGQQDAPVIRWKEEARVLTVGGHYRNGILLAPITAERVERRLDFLMR